MSSINAISRADAFKLYDYFKEHKALIAQMSFKELVEFARICVPEVGEWTIRDYTQNHGVVYKRVRPENKPIAIDASQLDRIEAKVNRLLEIWDKE